MKTHPFDRVSFLSGFVITSIGLIFLIPATPSDVADAVSKVGVWFWPVLFLALGLAVIIPVLVPKKQGETESPHVD